MIKIKTYQDFLESLTSERTKMDFILSAISEHTESNAYKIAADAELYYRHENPTIMRYQKYLTNRFGEKVPNIWSANNKIASNWYFYFVTQAVQYLLGNGINFSDSSTKEKLGEDFEQKLQKVATFAKNGSCGYGFWNTDHLDVFSFKEFVPLFDEEDGALKAGIRFWQFDNNKPLRATLYEIDGITDYIKRNKKEMEILREKRPYSSTVIIEGGEVVEEIFDGENYPTFPIVPLFNVNKQSELVGTRGTIDAFDLTASSLVNNISEGQFIYWVLKNCNAMDEEDDARFVEQLMLTHIAHADGDEGSSVEAHQVETPFAGTQTTLEVLRNQLFKDFMALDVEKVSAGNVTATQIQAAYEPINEKTDLFEFNVIEFVNKILALAGIEDSFSFTRSVIATKGDDIQNLIMCAEYLDDETMVKKISTLLGFPDEAEEILKRKGAEEIDRYREEPEDYPDEEGEIDA